MLFPNLDTVNENADQFASEEFSPSCSDSMAVSIQMDLSAMADKNTGSYQVLGSNILAAAVTDMVPVKDESGNAGPIAMGTPFVKSFFPYKYIGIAYSANGNIGAGTFSAYIEKKVTRVNIA